MAVWLYDGIRLKPIIRDSTTQNKDVKQVWSSPVSCFDAAEVTHYTELLWIVHVLFSQDGF